MKRWLNKGKLSIYMWCRPPLKWNLFRGHKGFYPMNKIFHEMPEDDWFIYAKYVSNGNQQRNKNVDSTAYKTPKSPDDGWNGKGSRVNYGSFNGGDGGKPRGPSYWEGTGDGEKKLYFNQKDRDAGMGKSNGKGKGGGKRGPSYGYGGGMQPTYAGNSPYGGAQPYNQDMYGSSPVPNRSSGKGKGKQGGK